MKDIIWEEFYSTQVRSSRFTVQGLWLAVQGSRFTVQGLWFRVKRHEGSRLQTVNLEPGTFNLEPSTWNLEPGTLNLKPMNLSSILLFV
ncbi:MAG: hypothetical protein KKC46_20265 [Proteobacteria bacterium]|nr:hypothetical protein [Pseudomonadota bacterium]